MRSYLVLTAFALLLLVVGGVSARKKNKNRCGVYKAELGSSRAKVYGKEVKWVIYKIIDKVDGSKESKSDSTEEGDHDDDDVITTTAKTDERRRRKRDEESEEDEDEDRTREGSNGKSDEGSKSWEDDDKSLEEEEDRKSSTRVEFQISDGDELFKDGGRAKGFLNKHFIDKFRSDNFCITSVRNATIPNGDGEGLCLWANGTLRGGSATVDVMVCIARDNITITQGEEQSVLLEGQVKFSVGLKDWTFCGCRDGEDPATSNCENCKNGKVGEGLEVRLRMHTPGSPKRKHLKSDDDGDKGRGKKKANKLFDLGDDAKVLLSDMIKCDGEYVNMTALKDDTPRIETQGSNNYLVLYFPRFNESCEYDPTVSASQKIDPTRQVTTPKPGSGIKPLGGWAASILTILVTVVVSKNIT